MYAYPAGPSGDDADFAALCERYRPRLVALCRRRLRTSHDAEDAAHEVLLRAYQAGPDQDTDVWPWLRTVAARVCVDIQRRAARPPLPSTDAHVPDDVHDQFARRLRADIVEDAIDRLPVRHRTTLFLKEYAGWTYDEIARVQGRSRSSVRSLLSRSRRRLGTQVESVARARGQWPLPGAVPPVQRLRGYMRSWRDAIERSGHAVVAALELSSVATRWMIGAPVMASVLTLSGAAVATALPSGTTPIAPAPRSALDVEVRRDHSVTAGASAAPITATASVGVTRPEGAFTGVDAVKAVPDGYKPVDARGSAGVTDYDEVLWIGWDQSVVVPVVGEVHNTGGTNLVCSARPEYALACDGIRTVLPYVPSS